MLSKTIIAIICITILATMALFLKIDGAILATAMAAITGLAGYQVGTHRKPKS